MSANFNAAHETPQRSRRAKAIGSGPGAFPDWERALQSREGLARRHDVGGFVLALYATLREGGDEGSRQALLPGIVEALRALP